ncbi:MAG: DUF4388 domain-containing protein [Candidatus Eremiobacterota bacterium]
MVTEISGNIKDLKLVNLLVLMCNKKDQAGKLIFSNGDEHGEVYVDKGNIVHATYEHMTGLDALYTLLTWNEGDFEFLNNDRSSITTISMDTKELLKDCLQKRKELAVIQELILNPGEIFKLSGRSSGKISMTTDDLNVISFLDGKRTIKEVEIMSDKNRFDLFKTLCRLLYYDVIIKVDGKGHEEKSNNKGPFITLENLEHIEKNLKPMVGPSTSVMLDTCIRSLGHERSRFPASKLDDFIDTFVLKSNLRKDDVKSIVDKVMNNGRSDEINLENNMENIVNPELFDNIEKRLKSLAGPASSLILKKCMNKLGYERNNFPFDKLTALLEAFCKEGGVKQELMADIFTDIEKINGNLDKSFPTQPIDNENDKNGGFFSFLKRK